MWWLSIVQAVNSLIHAGAIAYCGVVQLPALRLTAAEIVDGLAEAFGKQRASLVRYCPDDRIEATFGRLPELDVTDERALGFADDGSAAMLIRNALAHGN